MYLKIKLFPQIFLLILCPYSSCNIPPHQNIVVTNSENVKSLDLNIKLKELEFTETKVKVSIENIAGVSLSNLYYLSEDKNCNSQGSIEYTNFYGNSLTIENSNKNGYKNGVNICLSKKLDNKLEHKVVSDCLLIDT